MFFLPSSLCALLYVLLFSGFVTAHEQQYPIIHSEKVGLATGITGRLFHFNINSSVELERVLSIADLHALDVWYASPNRVDIFTRDDTEQRFKGLDKIGLPVPTNSSIMPLFPPVKAQNDDEEFHAAYHPLFEIDQFISELASNYSDFATLVRLGHSAEGRELIGLKLSLDKDDSPSQRRKAANAKGKPSMIIVGAQHAREWIATSTAIYLSESLLASANSSTSLLNLFDVHIIPVPNPDGYVYTWESDRFWYKNRQVMDPKSKKCIGLDMNRNWGYKFKRTPVPGPFFSSSSSDTDEDYSEYESPPFIPPSVLAKLTGKDQSGSAILKPREPVDPCSHWYPGHRAFESPEVNSIANYVTTVPDVKIFLDLRSYGQMVSAPWSFTCKRLPKDAEDQMEAAINSLHHLGLTDYTVGTLCQNTYPAPGNVIDYMYKRKFIKYSLAVHLRDTGTYGFTLPASYIRPVGQETVGMVEGLGAFVIKREGGSKT